jgi:uncharacterized membrane protein
MWYDEAFAVLFAEKGLSAMIYGTLTPDPNLSGGAAADVHPLLYYTLLSGWVTVSQAAGWVRLLSVIFGVVTLIFAYLLSQALFEDERFALITTGIIAFAPFYIHYSTEARMYALLGMLTVIATWCYVRGVRTLQPGYWIGLAVCAGLAMYTQQLAAFYLLGLGIAALRSGQRAIMLRMILAGFGAMVIYFPWLIQLPAQLGKVGAYWIERPGVGSLLLTLRSFVFVEMDVDSPIVSIMTLIIGVLIVIFLVYGLLPVIRRRAGKRNTDRDALGLLLWLTFFPILSMWAVSQWRPVYLNRALLPSFLMFMIAVGWLLYRSPLLKPMRLILTGAITVSFLLGAQAFYTWQTFPRGKFAEETAYVRTQLQPGDQIIHANKITALPYHYYDRGLPVRYVNDRAGSGTDTLAYPTQDVLKLYGSACIEAATKGASRVWYIKFERQGEADIAWLKANYRLVSERHANDLTTWLFDQPSLNEGVCP